MAGLIKSQNDAQKNAEKYFKKAAQDPVIAKPIRKKERAITSVITARLLGLRLAKKAADKDEANKLATEEPNDNRPARAQRPIMRLTF